MEKDMPLFRPEPSPESLASIQETILLEFGTNECKHCLAAEPLIHGALALYPHIRRIKIEDGAGRPLGRSFKVKLWPSLILVQKGEEIARLVRPTDAQAIEELLAKVTN